MKITIPQARIPLGWATIDGQRVPVEIDTEWMRAFETLVDRSGGVFGVDDVDPIGDQSINAGALTDFSQPIFTQNLPDDLSPPVLPAISRPNQFLSVKDFGAQGDGVTDDTSAINTATVAAIAAGRLLFWPSGTYIATQINALSNMQWIGESINKTIIKLKSGTNPIEGFGALLWSSSLNIDDIRIENITFDGNSAGNTQGDTITLFGARPRLHNIAVLNSASNAIKTDWAGPSFRPYGFEGRFTDITIDSSQKSGWIHRGPSDSHFDNIMIIDAGIKTNNSFYGMYLDPAGSGANGRFDNLHNWNRSSVSNVATTGVYVGFNGNTFTNCHFEGGIVGLNVASGSNTFESCDYYAPRGIYAVTIGGSTNKLSGCIGATFFTGNRNYTGINLTGASNMIDVVVQDQVNAINFNDSGSGGNFVTINGFLNAPGTHYTGTYAGNDVINIFIQGITSGTLCQGIDNSNFLAYQSSSQALVASAWTAIDCPNKIFDTNQEYDPSVSRFTPKVDGMYMFSAGMFFNSTTTNIKAIGIYVNGVLRCNLQYFGSVGQVSITGTTPPLKLFATDQVQARYFSGIADTSIPGLQYVFFGGCRIK